MKINCGDNNNEFKLSCDSSIRGDAWEGRKGRERELWFERKFEETKKKKSRGSMCGCCWCFCLHEKFYFLRNHVVRKFCRQTSLPSTSIESKHCRTKQTRRSVRLCRSRSLCIRQILFSILNFTAKYSKFLIQIPHLRKHFANTNLWKGRELYESFPCFPFLISMETWAHKTRRGSNDVELWTKKN